MLVIPASDFKARCLALLDEVDETGVPLVITKHGRPVARVVPMSEGAAPSLLGSVVLGLDDAAAPTGVAWEADQT